MEEDFDQDRQFFDPTTEQNIRAYQVYLHAHKAVKVPSDSPMRRNAGSLYLD
jgi:hypothetical protein